MIFRYQKMKMHLTLSLELFESFDLISLGSKWQGLEAVAETSFFQSWLWISTWLRHIPPSAKPQLLEWRQGTLLVGLGLLCENDHYILHRLPNRAALLHDTGCSETNFVIEYNGLLIRRGYEAEVAESCLRYVLDQPRWNELVLNGVRHRDPLLTHPQVRQKFIPDEINASPSWYVNLRKLRDTGKTALDTMSANARQQLRRRIRQLEQQGALTVDCAPTVAQAVRYFSELKILHQNYWQSRGKPGSFAKPAWEAFQRDLIANGFETGRIQLLRFKVGGETLGYLYNLVHQGRVSMLQSGFNYPRFSTYQPGYVCNHLAIQYNLEQGMDYYDFLAGDDQYKRSLAKESETLCWVSLRKKTLKNRIENFLLPIYRTWRGNRST